MSILELPGLKKKIQSKKVISKAIVLAMQCINTRICDGWREDKILPSR